MRNGRLLQLVCVGIAIGAVAGRIVGSAGAILGGAAGAICGWAVYKGALYPALRGAIIGSIFLVLVGPGLQYVILGVPVTEQLSRAIVAGLLVGAALAVRNANGRKRRDN